MSHWLLESQKWRLQDGRYSCRIWRYGSEHKYYWKVGISGYGWKAAGDRPTLRAAKTAVRKALLEAKP